MNINGKWYSEPELAAYIKNLEVRISVLEDKHHNECGQIAHYSDELRRAKELLREAQVLIKHSLFVNHKDTAAANEWYDKARKLIGGAVDENS